MSKLKERIEEINKTVQKSRRINNILWVVASIFVITSIYFAIDSQIAKSEAIRQKGKADTLALKIDTLYQEALLAKNQLAINDSLKEIEIKALLEETQRDNWEQVKTINNLLAFSTYFEEHQDDSEQVNAAVSELLFKEGYTQFVEKNGNKLYVEVNDLSLQGTFIKFKTDKAVRSGAIGINDCGKGSPDNTVRTGVVLKDKIVKVLDTCSAKNSNSKWVKIAYGN